MTILNLGTNPIKTCGNLISRRSLLKIGTALPLVGLLGSQPVLGGGRDRLKGIAGVVPRLTGLPSGCRFRDRCDVARPECSTTDPSLVSFASGRRAACVLVEGNS